jgi:hypothetical protein
MGQRLSERLREMKKQTKQESDNANALVVAKSNVVNSEFSKIVGRLSQRKTKRNYVDGSVFASGQNAANTVSLNRAVGNGPSSGMKLLG